MIIYFANNGYWVFPAGKVARVWH